MKRKRTMTEFNQLCVKLRKRETLNRKNNEVMQRERTQMSEYAGKLIIEYGWLPEIRWSFVSGRFGPNAGTVIEARGPQPNAVTYAKLFKVVRDSPRSPVLYKVPKHKYRYVGIHGRNKLRIDFPDRATALRFIRKHQLEVQCSSLTCAAKGFRQEAEEIEKLAAAVKRK